MGFQSCVNRPAGQTLTARLYTEQIFGKGLKPLSCRNKLNNITEINMFDDSQEFTLH